MKRKKLKFSRHADCLDVASTIEIGRWRDSHRYVRVMATFGEVVRRVTEIELNGRQFLADVITGSLYDVSTGRCLTGNLVIMGIAAPAAKERRSRSTKAQRASGWSSATREEAA